ncbi:MAG: cytochrome-c oxidase, cbb3-type subunit III [Alphaproteobacteria bacterium]|nr:MAG: cytochrome-c oxidase, cbb3-type subunit III [Alphaproteobacteria bacterium]
MTDNNKERDPISGIETTGHEWDGIKELNNPAPRWWLWVFIITIIWSIGYWVVYPAWPTIAGATKGKWNWTQYTQLKEKQAEILARQEGYLQKLQTTKLEDISKDPALYEFARLGGAVTFKENCAACHNSGGQGRRGYPNLNDDDWLFGGKLGDIYKTIKVGIRSNHPDTQGVQMPAFGKDGVLKQEQIAAVAEYVEKLHLGDKAERAPAYEEGRKIFTEQCSSCHGNNGEGSRETGAPRLNDNIWLFGGKRENIVESISVAHAGVMPTWENRLDDNAIKSLAVYVHSLGGGEQ